MYDDLALIESNPSIRSFTNISRWFSTSFWREVYNPSSADKIPYYRPVVTSVLAVGHWIGGSDPAAYHAINLLIHCINTALVYALGLRYLPVPGAAAAAIFFGIHPVHVESVAWISGVSDLVATFAGLTAGWLVLASSDAVARHRSTGRAVALGAAAFAGFLVSFLSKESAVGIPLALLAVELFLSKESGARRFMPFVAPALAGIVYYMIRVAVFGPGAGFGIRQTGFLLPEWRMRSLRFELLKDYVATSFVPWNLNAFRTLRIDLEASSEAIRHAWLAAVTTLGTLFGLALASIRWHWARPTLAFSLFFLLTSIPQFAKPESLGHFIFAERYLYIPSIGIVWLLGHGIGALAKRSTAAALVLFLPAAGFCAWKTVERVPAWTDEQTLFTQSEKDSPDCATVKCALGRIYLNFYQSTGEVRWLDAAFEKFKAAIDQNLRDRVYVSNQDVIQSYLGVAAVQMIRGRTEEALSIYVQVSEKYPDCEEAWNLAGVAYSNLGSFDLAEKSFQKAIAIRPTFAAAHFNLGNYYINRNEFARAVTPLRESLRIEPSNVQACLALATAYANLRQPQDAVRTLTDYLAHFPQAPGADRVRQALAQLR